jgi:hypothetical protein
VTVALALCAACLGPAAGATAATSRPSLRVTALSALRTTVTAGSTLVVLERTRNVGTARARASHTGYYLAGRSRPGTGDVRLGRPRAVPRLRGGHASSVRRTLTVPATVRPGRYHLLACAHDGGAARPLPGACMAARSRLTITARTTASSAPSQPLPQPQPLTRPPSPLTTPVPPPPAPPPPPPPTEPVNPLDVFLADDALTMTGVDVHGFNDVASAITFRLATSAFSLDPGDTAVTVNGAAVAAAQVAIAADSVTVAGALVDGRNEILFAGADRDGRGLHHRAVVWAGSGELAVRLVDEAGDDFTRDADVKLVSADDEAVGAAAVTSDGAVAFANVPDRTMLVEATAAGNVRGALGAILADGPITLTMRGIGPASAVQDDDLAQGAAGWEVGSAPVAIVDHAEQVGPAHAASATTARSAGTRTRARRRGEAAAQASARDADVDDDLSLGTAGKGEQAISRTFTTDAGVIAVRVRYRFVTSEVSGGWFGSKFNDYSRVTLRSERGGGVASQSNSVDGLGLAAFDADGSTAWRDVTLPIDEAGDTVAVDLAVANVADEYLDSQVVVDFVEQIRSRVVPSLTWNAATGGLDLRYTVEGAAVASDRDVTVRFGEGPAYADRSGAVLFTHTVAAGTQPGTYGPFHVDGATLAGAPAGTTHLVAASDEADADALPDAQVVFGTNADPAAVSAAMLSAVRDSARAAGQAVVTITATARTPRDQARAMFRSLTSSARTTQQNVDAQHDVYPAAGDAVIDVFANDVAGLTPQQIQSRATQIRTDMLDEIGAQGCRQVTNHCADPAQLSVVDVGSAAFTTANGPLFVGAATARVTRLVDERATNGCYHLEL